MARYSGQVSFGAVAVVVVDVELNRGKVKRFLESCRPEHVRGELRGLKKHRCILNACGSLVEAGARPRDRKSDVTCSFLISALALDSATTSRC